VVLTPDVAYASIRGPGWIPPLLDVYAPSEAHDLPLVVMFHGAGPGVDKDSLEYPDLAEAIADEGAVVVVANWGQHGMPWQWSTADLIHVQRLMAEEGACAVSYAVTHAAEYGADRARLVLFGHSAGATEAGMVGLTEPAPLPGCVVSPTTWAVRGMMLWDGDFLLANPGFDVFRKDMARILEVMTPWPTLATAPHVRSVEFAVSMNSRDELSTPDASKDAEWLAWRDPTGTMQQDLDSLGAFDDGWLDVGEEAEAMILGLKASGIHASLLTFTDPSTTHESIYTDDFELMVEHVLSLTRN
jgi:hypothetical protein